MKKHDCCASARQELARGCGAKHTKEAWHLRPVSGCGQSITPAPQEQHLPRSVAGRIKGPGPASCPMGGRQPTRAIGSAARQGTERAGSVTHCPSPAGELDGETQFRYAAFVLNDLTIQKETGI